MKIWLNLPFLPTQGFRDLVLLAESLGVEGVAISEHVCVPATIRSPYPYLPSGKPGAIPIETEFPDPIVLIAALGAVTTSLRFMTNILIVPLRHPVLLAKEVATAACVTGGRLELGVGVGWMREEFDVLGVPFDRRGARLDESLAVMRELWSGEVVEHHGEHFSFGPIALHPTPPGRVAVLVGGHSDAALRRAAVSGDGWIGVNPPIDELVAHLGNLRKARAAAGTEKTPFEVRTGMKGALTPDGIGILKELGVDSLLIMPWQLAPEWASGGEISAAAVGDRLAVLMDQVRAA